MLLPLLMIIDYNITWLFPATCGNFAMEEVIRLENWEQFTSAR